MRAKPTRRGDTSDLRQIAYAQAKGRCQADGLHHTDCPQHVDNASAGEFVPHHVWPIGKGGDDDKKNLVWVWNGIAGRLGAGGCHQKIHDHSRLGRVLGLLRFSADDHLHGIGIDAALQAGELDHTHLTAAGFA